MSKGVKLIIILSLPIRNIVIELLNKLTWGKVKFLKQLLAWLSPYIYISLLNLLIYTYIYLIIYQYYIYNKTNLVYININYYIKLDINYFYKFYGANIKMYI